MIFQKPSPDARVVRGGMYQLGGHALFSAPTRSSSTGETVPDTRSPLAVRRRIMARVFAHQDIMDWRVMPPCP